MRTRSQELRERYRRILAWSLVAAVAAHVAVFVLAPRFRAGPLGSADLDVDTIGVAGGANAFVDVLFGPPSVRESDGRTWTAPDDRILPAERGVRLERQCLALLRPDRTPLHGRVQLRVKASGRVDVLALPGSTGDPCGDRILEDVAGDLWYHWLPSARFPAPVDVVQPVTLIAAR